ncbi:uncharacterized protein LOC120345765 [Styela clava]
MGNTPSRKNRKLEKAIQARKLKRVKRWLMKGADPNSYSKKSNYSLLSMAITLREEALVTALIQYGANPDQKSWLTTGKGTLQRKQANDDEYPIHIAASHGSEKIMKALLNSTIDINIGQDHKLGTALHQASRFGHSKLAELLLMNGADIIGIDSRLNMPLHVAATYGQTKVAEVLLRYGSPVNISNMKNCTPLHYASSEGAVSMVRLLLKHGGNPKAKDGAGSTPTDLAKSEHVLEVFLEHAVNNPDEDEVFSGEDTDANSKTLNQTGPPKPARTFALSSSALKGSFVKRERSHSQEMTLEPKSSQLEKSNTYSNFGHWKRNRKLKETSEQSKVIEQAENERNDTAHSKFRRTKSTPTRKKRAKHQHQITLNDNTHRQVERSMTQYAIGRKIPRQQENIAQEKSVMKPTIEKSNQDKKSVTNFRRTKSTPIRKKQGENTQNDNTHRKVDRSLTQYSKSEKIPKKEEIEQEKVVKSPIMEKSSQDDKPVTNFRRTKSTPIKKKHRHQRTKPQIKPIKGTVIRANSVQMKTHEPLEVKRMYSVRYANNHSKNMKKLLSVSEEDLPKVHRRSKSVPSLSNENNKQNCSFKNEKTKDQTKTEKNKPIQSETNIESSSASDTSQNEVKIQIHKQNYSHSLQDLTVITEESQNGDTVRDANYNFKPKRKANRTMSDRFSNRLNNIKNSFVKRNQHKKFIKQ